MRSSQRTAIAGNSRQYPAASAADYWAIRAHWNITNTDRTKACGRNGNTSINYTKRKELHLLKRVRIIPRKSFNCCSWLIVRCRCSSLPCSCAEGVVQGGNNCKPPSSVLNHYCFYVYNVSSFWWHPQHTNQACPSLFSDGCRETLLLTFFVFFFVCFVPVDSSGGSCSQSS